MRKCYARSAESRTGDAWLLDWEDGLASPLARDGDPEPIHIEETDTNFTVDWKGNYRIEGAAFIFVDRKTHGTRAILGYPTQKLEQLARGRCNFKYLWLGFSSTQKKASNYGQFCITPGGRWFRLLAVTALLQYPLLQFRNFTSSPDCSHRARDQNNRRKSVN
jgi:hypothetical protein